MQGQNLSPVFAKAVFLPTTTGNRLVELVAEIGLPGLSPEKLTDALWHKTDFHGDGTKSDIFALFETAIDGETILLELEFNPANPAETPSILWAGTLVQARQKLDESILLAAAA